jgi:hypothetical protein
MDGSMNIPIPTTRIRTATATTTTTTTTPIKTSPTVDTPMLADGKHDLLDSAKHSMSEIDNITLNYFANKAQYVNILKKTEISRDKKFKTNKKFYKKRILDLTKRLFRDDEEEMLDIHVNNSFNTYIKSCITYFMFLDKNDIIQEKYADDVTNETMLHDIDNIHETFGTTTETDNQLDNQLEYKNRDYLFSKPVEVKKVTLDTFVIKTTDNSKPIILPKREITNIKTKEHKTKGIKKKKNINNIYEETNNEITQHE